MVSDPFDVEEWSEIDGFPRYQISTEGRIYNKATNNHMRVSTNNYGHPKISLLNEQGRFTRSVALLVAVAFVEPPNVLCDRIIWLDGDLNNYRAWNLAWRPKWFCWKYTRQLKNPHPKYYENLRITNVATGVKYTNIVEAGMTEGLLFEHIWHSTYASSSVFPNGSIWVVDERV